MSKGLEALEMMNMTVDIMCSTEYNEAKNIVEKELKALAIIKEKNVDVNSLRFSDRLDWYNRYNHYLLTQEEYDLLKEVLL